jgi:hypothetical protein
MFVSLLKRHTNRQNKNDKFCPCVDCENKIMWPDFKIVIIPDQERFQEKLHNMDKTW